MVSAKATEQIETRERRTVAVAEENGHPGGTTAMEQAARDHVWIHQLPWAEFESDNLRIFDRGEGARLYDVQGREYLDGIAGLWVVNAGHGRQEIAQAYADQAARLVSVRLRDLLTAVSGVDDPQTGDAVEILPTVHVVEASTLAAVEDAEIVTFELGPRQLVDPDVVARGLLNCRSATCLPVSFSRDACSPLPCFDLFDCLRAHHRPVPPAVDRLVHKRRQA